MRCLSFLASPVMGAVLFAAPLLAQEQAEQFDADLFGRSNMAIKQFIGTLPKGSQPPTDPAPAALAGQTGAGGCPVLLWHSKQKGVPGEQYDLIELDQDASQIWQIGWNTREYQILYRSGARQRAEFQRTRSSAVGVVDFGCVESGLARLTVTDCATGRPLSNARVSLHARRPIPLVQDMRTDATGRLWLMCPGCELPETVDLQVSRDGYREHQGEVRFSRQRVNDLAECLKAPDRFVPAPKAAAPQPVNVAPKAVEIPQGFDRKRSATDRATGHAYASSTGAHDWAEARQLCQAQGGHLATITSRWENNFLVQTFNTDRRLWLGGTDDTASGQWEWITGERWGFTNWNPGEPNNSGGGEFFLQYDQGGKWNDEGHPGGSHHFGFLCEWEPQGAPTFEKQSQLSRDPAPVEPEPEPRPATPHSPAGAVVDPATGHAYRRSDGRATWAEGFQLCLAEDGHLATITSKRENDFVAAHFNGSRRIWLGGTDAGREGQWQWVTGEPFSFRGFGEGEPNDQGQGEDYLELGDGGQWNDDGAPKEDRSFFFLCEWEPR